MSLSSPKLIPVLLIPLFLTGCQLSTNSAPAGNVQSAALSGRVFGGQQPIATSSIKIYTFGSTGYGSAGSPLASTNTDANGFFQFANGAYTCTPDQPVYITASGGNPGAGNNNDAVMAVAIGNCSTAPNVRVVINEVTTVATAFALAQFYNTANMGTSPSNAEYFGGPIVNSKGLVMAANYTVPTLVNLGQGQVNPNTSVITIEGAKINSIANTLAACINSTGSTSTTETTTACGKLYSYTKASYATRPADTLQAAISMALNPRNNISNLYALAPSGSPFTGLSAAPNDGTIGVSYTAPSSSNIKLAVNTGTNADLAIDANGKVWFPSNASTTTSGVASFDPTINAFTLVSNVNLSQPQNLAITTATPNVVLVTDRASGNLVRFTTGSNAQTFNTLANAKLGAIALDTTGSVYVTYDNTQTAGHFIAKNSATTFTSFSGTTYASTSIASSSTAGNLYTAATSGTQSYLEQVNGGTNSVFATAAATGISGQVVQINKSGAATQLFWTVPSTSNFCMAGPISGCSAAGNLSVPEDVAVDGLGNVIVANSGRGQVSRLVNPNVTNPAHESFIHDSTNGNTMSVPYGIGVDASGNIWAINAGCTTTSCSPGPAVLSEIVGAAGPTITPIAAQIANGVNTIGTLPRN